MFLVPKTGPATSQMAECGCELDREALSSDRVYWVDYRQDKQKINLVYSFCFIALFCEVHGTKYLFWLLTLKFLQQFPWQEGQELHRNSTARREICYLQIYSSQVLYFMIFILLSFCHGPLPEKPCVSSEVSSVGLVWEARDTANNNMRVAVKTPKNPATPTDWPGNWWLSVPHNRTLVCI